MPEQNNLSADNGSSSAIEASATVAETQEAEVPMVDENTNKLFHIQYLSYNYRLECKHCSVAVLDPDKTRGQVYLKGRCPSCGEVSFSGDKKSKRERKRQKRERRAQEKVLRAMKRAGIVA